MCNFAPPDMVGHTGQYEAAIKVYHFLNARALKLQTKGSVLSMKPARRLATSCL